MTTPSKLPAFDELKRLAEQDPQALEALRTRLVEEVIENADPESQPRLRGLQFQVDMERRRAKTPMASCIKVSELMQASLLRLQAALNGDVAPSAPAARPATLLAFPEPRPQAQNG
ncbi:MAG: DUF3135 domain-containing protein [Pseudomonadota bacterium]|nr:DUF3135 domain-containing protein [Pseudomonadota bacterium]